MQLRWIQTASRYRCGLQTSLRSLHERIQLLSCGLAPAVTARAFHDSFLRGQDVTALRKELKDEKKASRASKRTDLVSEKLDKDAIGDWKLTVGIEIHAQLNTARKLFSGTSN